MTQNRPTPPLPDLARAQGHSVPEVGEWFVEYLNTKPVPWNYRRSTRIVRVAYKGLHRTSSLVAGCMTEKNATGRKANSEVVSLAAPLAFGRATQVFDLSPRRFSFGRDSQAGYRIPFLFVEDGKIKVYFLQPRKNTGLNLDELAMIATVIKKYLLDVEFYGEPTDVEFVDVSAPEIGAARVVNSYTLSKLRLWSEKRLSDRLTLISEGLDWAYASGRIESRRRVFQRQEPEMPLFD